MVRKQRRLLVSICAASLLLLIVAAISVGLWLWWPDANKLTGYAARGDVSGVRLCLSLGVDPDEPSRYGWKRHAEGQTPLTAAAQGGHVDVIRILLENGADPNLLDSGSRWPHETALSTAAIHGRIEVCRVLLDAGADPNIPTNPRGRGDTGGWTALDWALQGKQSDVAQLLRERGAIESGRRITER
jgi:ankyrin repeat protein